MWRRRRRGRSTSPDAPRDVAEKCQSFLAGRYVDHLRAAGRPTPPWAQLNSLVHAPITTRSTSARGSAMSRNGSTGIPDNSVELVSRELQSC
jgi:hypothetical protein